MTVFRGMLELSRTDWTSKPSLCSRWVATEIDAPTTLGTCTRVGVMTDTMTRPAEVRTTVRVPLRFPDGYETVADVYTFIGLADGAIDCLCSDHTPVDEDGKQLPFAEAAADYERQLAALLNSGVRIGLGLLGLGADGHTASLFGAADLERARGHLAIAVHRPDGMSAVSVTPDLLATVKEPVFVVAGAGKEAALKALLGQDSELVAWRAVQGCRDVELWMTAQG